MKRVIPFVPSTFCFLLPNSYSIIYIIYPVLQYAFGRKRQVIDETWRTMTISGDVIDKVESLKYLRSFVWNNGGFNEHIKNNVFFFKWKDVSCILSDKRIPIRLKGKYGKIDYVIWSKYWVVDENIEQTMSVSEMRTLSWIRRNVYVAIIVDKIRKIYWDYLDMSWG